MLEKTGPLLPTNWSGHRRMTISKSAKKRRSREKPLASY